jgi:UDP:flavonoid glycosyltransferase YjiC (YdhE family)
MIAIPAGEDQPGVAARIARIGAGLVIPAKQLSTAGLTVAIANILEDPRFQVSASSTRAQLQGIDGVQNAIDLIEKMA